MKATPANVSRVLTKGGHEKSKPYPSAIRGWRNHSSGFVTEANKSDPDSVIVRFRRDGIYDPRPVDAKEATRTGYRKTLEPHFHVTDGPDFTLLVTGRETKKGKGET